MVQTKYFIIALVLTVLAPFTIGSAIYDKNPDNLTIDCPECDFVAYRHTAIDNWTRIEANPFILEKGILDGMYEFYVMKDKKNPLRRIHFNEKNDLLKNHTIKLITESSESSYFCNPFKNDFSCKGMTYLQGLQALRFLNGYQLTGNITLLNFSKSFLLADYGDASTCNPALNDFNCGYNQQGVGVREKNSSGAKTQGTMISALWQIYERTGEFKGLALNYTQGHPDECDVWNNDFDCGDAQSQGYMIEGYQMAYLITGNDTYKRIVLNLSKIAIQEEYSHPMILKGFSLIALNNSIIKRQAESLEKCEACNVPLKWEYVTAYLEAFLTTRDHSFLESATHLLMSDSSNSRCTPMNESYICNDEESQALMSLIYFAGYLNIDKEKKLFNIQTRQTLRPMQNLTINFSWKGLVENRTIYYSFDGNEWMNDSDIVSSFTINSSVLNSNGILQVYFTANNRRYPKESTFNFFINEMDSDSAEKYGKLSTSDPRSFCDPLGTNLRLSDYNCKYEHFQGWMINGFSLSSELLMNQSLMEKAFHLASVTIDPSGRYATCDHGVNDYDCNDVGTIFISEFNPLAGKRQGSIAYSYLKLYEHSKQMDFLDMALRYLMGKNQNCDVWNNNFTCKDSESQAYMILAYTKAYQITGQEIFRDISSNLSANAKKYNHTELLLFSLWENYEILQEETKEFLFEGMNKSKNKCIEEACTVKDFGINLLLYWSAYRTNLNETYRSLAFNKYLKLPDPTVEYGTGAQYYDCSLKKYDLDFQCRTPEKQGLLNMALGLHTSTYIKTNYSMNLSIETPSEVDFDSLFEVNIIFKNTDTFNLKDVLIFIDSPGLSVINISPSNISKFSINKDKKGLTYSSIPSGEVISTIWVVNASAGGKHSLMATSSVGSAYESTSKSLNITNIGDTPFIKPPYIRFAKKKQIINDSFLIDNPYDFPISNLSICFSNQRSNYFEIINLTGDANKVNESCFLRDALNTQMMEQSDNFTINATMWTGEGGHNVINISLKSKYNAYQNISYQFYIYDDLINKDSKFPSTYSVKRPFDLLFNISNSEDFDLENVTLHFDIGDNLVVQSYTYNFSENITNSSTDFIKLSKLGTEGSCRWRIYSIRTGLNEIKFTFKNPYLTKNYSLGEIEIISKDIYDIDYHIPKAKAGKGHRFMLDLRNKVNGSLYNVTIDFSTTAGINITNLSSKYEFYEPNYVTPKDYYINGPWESYENNTIHATYWNMTFNLSSIQGQHINLTLFYDINESVNMSCWYNFKETLEPYLQPGLINGSPNIETILLEQKDYTINFSQNVSTVYLYFDFDYTDQINDTELGMISDDNGTLCTFNLSQMDSEIECNANTNTLYLNMAQTSLNQTVDLNISGLVSNQTKIRRINGTQDNKSCILPVFSDQMNIASQISYNTTIGEIQGVLNSSYLYNSSGIIDGSSVIFEEFNSSQHEIITGYFDVITKQGKEFMMINIDSQDGANYYINELIRDQANVQDPKAGNSGEGKVPPINPIQDNFSVTIINYTFDEYNISKIIEERVDLAIFDFANLSNQDIYYTTMEMINCFTGSRTIYRNNSNLRLNYQCNRSLTIFIYDYGFPTEEIQIETNLSYRKFQEGILFNGTNNSRIIINYSGRISEFKRPVIFLKDSVSQIPTGQNPINGSHNVSQNFTEQNQKIYNLISIESKKIFQKIKKTVNTIIDIVPFFFLFIFTLIGGLFYVIFKKNLIPDLFYFIERGYNKLILYSTLSAKSLYSRMYDNYYYFLYILRRILRLVPKPKIVKRSKSEKLFFDALSLSCQVKKIPKSTILEKINQYKIQTKKSHILSLLEKIKSEAYTGKKTFFNSPMRDRKIFTGPVENKDMEFKHKDIFFLIEEINYDLNQGNEENARKNFSTLKKMLNDTQLVNQLKGEDFYAIFALYDEISNRMNESSQ